MPHLFFNQELKVSFLIKNRIIVISVDASATLLPSLISFIYLSNRDR